MDNADTAMIYYSRHALELKKLPYFNKETVIEAFGRNDINVFNESNQIVDYLHNIEWKNTNLLMMSSGDFDGINLKFLADSLTI